MYHVAQVRKIEWPVDVHIPQDGGKVQKQRFTAEFEILPTPEYQALAESGDDVLERVLTGWGADLKNEAGDAPLEFNEENKAMLLKIPYVRVALLRAYMQAQTGQEAAKKI